MAKQNEENGKAAVQFNEAELDALRTIIRDWITEQVVAPPYSPEVASIIEKLGVAEEEPVVAAQAQDVGARPFQMDSVPSQG
jgi:hypothetical protein